MREELISIRNKTHRELYQKVLKRLLFKIDPETIHDFIVKTSAFAGKTWPTKAITRAFFSYQNAVLEQNILGVHFKNPIGLAAGFDKNVDLLNIFSDLGFGFAEVGSITGEPCEGNPKPRLHRLIRSQSIVVNYGLKNDGALVLKKKFNNQHCSVPIGISIAKTNCKKTVNDDAGIADYKKAYLLLRENGDYVTINISCPNTFGGMPFEDARRLKRLLHILKIQSAKKPVFIKLSPDLTSKKVSKIVALGEEYGISGYICTNLTKRRDKKKIYDPLVPRTGGLSGKLVEHASNTLISDVYAMTGGKRVIVGCGGVFSASDAYKKIQAGASLVQLVTGMIFMGPHVISEINQGLVNLLKRDGFSSISDAVGTKSVYNT